MVISFPPGFLSASACRLDKTKGDVIGIDLGATSHELLLFAGDTDFDSNVSGSAALGLHPSMPPEKKSCKRGLAFCRHGYARLHTIMEGYN